MKTISTYRLMAVLGLVFGSLMALTPDSVVFGQDSIPDNVFVASPVLPKDLKRVLVLPLTFEKSRGELSSGCDMLGPVLLAGLSKTQKFEVIPAGPEMLRSLTGQSAWTGAEVLPVNFFDSLQRTYGCDAILFCQLTAFCAYAPLEVGLRMKLVDVHSLKILWAADELFDAGEPAVAKGAEQFEKLQQNVHGKTRSLLKRILTFADRQPQSALDDQWDILNSPHYFGQYAVVKVLQTLPER